MVEQWRCGDGLGYEGVQWRQIKETCRQEVIERQETLLHKDTQPGCRSPGGMVTYDAHNFPQLKETGAADKQTRVPGRGSAVCIRMRIRPTRVPFPTSVNPSQKGHHHTLIGWKRKCPGLLSLINYGLISTPCAHLNWIHCSRSRGIF